MTPASRLHSSEMPGSTALEPPVVREPFRSGMLSAWLPAAGTALAASLILLGSGVGPGELARFSAYVVLAVALPGVFCWRLLLRRFHTDGNTPPTWFEDLSLGTIFGFGIQLPVYLAGVWVGVPLLFLILPVLVLGLTITGYGRRVWTLPTGRADVRVSWVLAAVIVYGLARLARDVFPLRSLTLSLHKTTTTDETFHQALIAELSHRFPPEIPFVLHTPLDYHWFAHAQIATARWATGVDSTVMLRQLVPALALALAVVGLGAVALRLTGRPVAAVIAPALLVAGAFHLIGPHYESYVYTEPYLSKRFVSSISQAYGVMMSMPALMLLLEVLRPNHRVSRATWATLAITLFALSGSKATFMPIFLCGAVAVWVHQLVVHRRVDRRASALVVLLVIVTAFAQLVLFGGQGGALALDPFATVDKALDSQRIAHTPLSQVAMTLTLLTGWLLYGVGAFGLLKRRRWRDPRAVWMLAAVPAGISVAFLFFRSGLSQLWFQRSVAELVVLLSAWGMACLLPRPLTRRRALVLCGLAVSAGVAAFAVSSYVESRKEDAELATLDSLVLTLAAPLAVLLLFVLVRWVLGLVRKGSRPGPLVLLPLLLGLGLTHVSSLVYDTVTQRPLPQREVDTLYGRGAGLAAAYVARHSSPDDVVATNIHCVSARASRCDNRTFWVSALTERRVVIEGWGYTPDTNVQYKLGRRNAFLPVPYPRRLAVNDAAFKRPSAKTVGRLVDEYGVDWLFVGRRHPADIKALTSLTSLLDRAFRNKHYIIFEVVD